MSRDYSFAGPEKGTVNPDEIEVYNISECENERAKLVATTQASTIIQWDGSEYSRRLTWIMADEDSILDLEDCR